MAISRRRFVAALGAGGAAIVASPFVHARGREALAVGRLPQGVEERKADRRMASKPGVIRIDSNENPVGPGAKAVAAIRLAVSQANRYPVLLEDDLKDAIAKKHGVNADQVILGCGSGELLRSAVQAFTSRDRAYVAPAPTFETPGQFAAFIGTPVHTVPVDESLNADLDGLAKAARGAGLVYLCNPNNPTATVHTKADIVSFIEKVIADSPQTTLLIDEAYFEYVDAPGYGTVIPLAIERPQVIVARTFSKVFGMAGLRVGYAIGGKDVLAKMMSYQLASNISQLSLAAAAAALEDTAHVADEASRNRVVRAFTRGFFGSQGYAMSAAQANFMMVDIKRDAKAFKSACLLKGVAVGRAFPPLTNHTRISFGTLAEMQKAVEVFRAALA